MAEQASDGVDYGPVTQLLRRWTDGDADALHRLVPLVYKELRHLAGRHLRHERDEHTLQRTGLVHEVFLRLGQGSAMQWQSRAQFFSLASKLMRHVLVDHARARRADKRGAGVPILSIEQVEIPAFTDERLDLLALDEALQRLERLDPQQSRVVELRFFGGLSIEETATALEVSPATVKREWACARAWLLRELGGWRAPAASTAPASTDSTLAPAA